MHQIVFWVFSYKEREGDGMGKQDKRIESKKNHFSANEIKGKGKH